MVIRLVAHIWALDKQHRRWSRRCSRSWRWNFWPGPSPPRCGGAAVPVLGLPASGVPDGGPAPVDPAPARANDPTILAWTTHSGIGCTWASRN